VGAGILVYAAALRTNPLADLADDLDGDDPQVHARLPALTTLRPRLPRELTALIDACLEPEPGRRPQVGEAVEVLYALSW